MAEQQRDLFTCSGCKKRFHADGFEVDRLGRQRKCCIECKATRERYKCPHGRKRAGCRDCGGASICHHDRIRRQCRECGGGSMCEHNRQRHNCRECGGSSICEHGRQRHCCRECGTSFCEHGHERRRCHECGGSSICKHDRFRSQCRNCNPAGHLRSLVATRIHDALKTGKNMTSLEYLGCPIDDFKSHIEGTFEPGMSWENHGRISVDGPRVWNIDHIIPIKYPGADGGPPSLEEVAARLHWTNTKAMWADENIAKGNRFVDAPQLAVPVPQLTDDEIAELLDDILGV